MDEPSELHRPAEAPQGQICQLSLRNVIGNIYIHTREINIYTYACNFSNLKCLHSAVASKRGQYPPKSSQGEV